MHNGTEGSRYASVGLHKVLDMRKLWDSERSILTKTLQERGQLFFPVSSVVIGAIAGSLIRMQRLGSRYTPSLRERIFARISESYRCITDFICSFGPQKLRIEPDYEGDKEGLRVFLQRTGNVPTDKNVGSSKNA
jgi:hypothetical protein